MQNILSISNLNIWINGKKIVRNLDFKMAKGYFYVLMGPNGSGKSTLALSLAGFPGFRLSGVAIFNGKNILKLTPEKRARLGILVTFQNPVTVPGVPLSAFLRESKRALIGKKDFDIEKFFEKLLLDVKFLGLDKSFLDRPLNDGFSGGERKKVELLTILTFKPKIVIMDEIDTGLDIDAIKLVSKVIKRLKDEKTTILLITHNTRILQGLNPHLVQIIKKGKILKSGRLSLAKNVEKYGYENI